ncbi:YciI family protein [Brevibacterium sp.]|uniref:YciI family protein n=1 Tax=Brevibacterium sp. TaxID=1701 RepID=UPI00281215EB|nr:YciI family protein [Brevibacterium sp.]
MKYVLLLMGDHQDAECGDQSGPDPAEFMKFDQEITEAGVVVGGFALEGPETAVRVSADSESEELLVTSGPFAETGDFVGGSYVIEVADIDEAIAWAKRSPGARFGHIEIRPVAEY